MGREKLAVRSEKLTSCLGGGEGEEGGSLPGQEKEGWRRDWLVEVKTAVVNDRVP